MLARNGERLLEILHLRHQLRDCGDVDHRELSVSRWSGRHEGENDDGIETLTNDMELSCSMAARARGKYLEL